MSFASIVGKQMNGDSLEKTAIVNSKNRNMANHPPITTYYANAKLFSRRIRKRPIKRVSGLSKSTYSED